MLRVFDVSQFKTLVTSIFLLLFFSACSEKPKPGPAKPAAVPIKVAQAEVRDIHESREYSGRFAASRRVELQARVDGYLKSVNFDDGELVSKGEVLFEIDSREFQIAVDSAQAAYKLANNEFKRSSKLRKSGAVAEEDYEASRERLAMAKAELDQAKLDLDFTQIRAPFTGRAGRNLVDEGTLITSSTGPLTTILAIDPIEFYFYGSEADLLRYKRAREQGLENTERGAPYPVNVKLQDEDDYQHSGVINFLNNEISQETGSIEVRAVFGNSEGLLEPGMFGRLVIHNGTPRRALVVPQTIIGTEQSRRFVYSVDGDQVKRNYVTLGEVTKDGLQVVLSGISEDDQLVMTGLHKIRPGVVVTPTPFNNQQAAVTKETANSQSEQSASKATEDEA